MKLTQQQKEQIIKEIKDKGLKGDKALNYGWIRARKILNNYE